MCSASCRQAVIRKKLVSPSRPAVAVLDPGVTARRKLVTAAPLGVKVTSGSSVRLPVMVTWVSGMVRPLLGARGGAGWSVAVVVRSGGGLPPVASSGRSARRLRLGLLAAGGSSSSPPRSGGVARPSARRSGRYSPASRSSWLCPPGLPAGRALLLARPGRPGLSGPPRRRSGQGAAAGRASTHERAAALDRGGGEVAARPAGKRPGPVGAGSRRPAQQGGRSAPARWAARQPPRLRRANVRTTRLPTGSIHKGGIGGWAGLGGHRPHRPTTAGGLWSALLLSGNPGTWARRGPCRSRTTRPRCGGSTRRSSTARNPDALDELLVPDGVDHTFGSQSTEQAKQFFAMVYQAFPDLHAEVHDVIAEGDLVAVRSTYTSTHQGEFLGIPATGKQTTTNGVDYFRMQDGKQVEHWGGPDTFSSPGCSWEVMPGQAHRDQARPPSSGRRGFSRLALRGITRALGRRGRCSRSRSRPAPSGPARRDGAGGAWASGPRPPRPARPRRRRGGGLGGPGRRWRPGRRRGRPRPRPAAADARPAPALSAPAARSQAVAVAVGWRLDGQVPLEAAQGLLAGRLRLHPGPSTGQDLGGPPGPGQGDHGVRACPVAVADGRAGHHQVLEAAPGDVPGFALAGLLHRAGLDPGPLPDPGRAVPGRPRLVEPPGLLDHLDDPGGAQQRLGVGHGMDEQPARAGPDQAGAAGPHPPARPRTGRTGTGRSRHPGPARRAGWRPRGPRRWPRTRRTRGWRPRPCGACGGWRSGRSPPATAACRHRRPRGRPGRGRGGRRSRRPRTTSPPRRRRSRRRWRRRSWRTGRWRP